MGLFDKLKDAANSAIDTAKKAVDDAKAANEEKLRIDKEKCGTVQWGLYEQCVVELIEESGKFVFYKLKHETYAGGHVSRDIYEEQGTIDPATDIEFFWIDNIEPEHMYLKENMIRLDNYNIVFYMPSKEFVKLILNEKDAARVIASLMKRAAKMDAVTLEYGNLFLEKHGISPIEREVNFDLTNAIPDEFYTKELAILEAAAARRERIAAERKAAEERLEAVKNGTYSSQASGQTSNSRELTHMQKMENKRKREAMCRNCINKNGCPAHMQFDYTSSTCNNFRSNK